MSYTINKTDGSVLTEIIDGNVDQVATSLTLIGKSASSYGEYLNENLIHLLENFANSSQPSHPVSGQLWYDTNEQRLKVYDGNGFKLTSSTVVADEVPSSIVAGDIWIDSKRQQLYFNDGVATILAGPWNPDITGFTILDVYDTYGLSHSVMVLRLDSKMVGIFSVDEFTPSSPILDYPFSKLKIGLNLITQSFITNVANSVDDYDAVNKQTMDASIKLAPLVISLNTAGLTNDDIISNYLNILFPPLEYSVNGNGPSCKVISTDAGVVSIKPFILTTGEWAEVV